VRRLGIDNGDELGRDLVVPAAKNNGRGVGEADLRGAGRNLLYRIR